MYSRSRGVRFGAGGLGFEAPNPKPKILHFSVRVYGWGFGSALSFWVRALHGETTDSVVVKGYKL